jgi:hypothetical protein
MYRMNRIAMGAAILSVALAAWAQKPAVYPAKGQSADQQRKDDGECYAWAKQSTGIDPANPTQGSQTASAPPRKGGVAKGAAAGAAVGAIGGNDVGNAAVKGAVIGGVAQRSRNKGQQEAQQQASAQQSQQAMQTYYRAYGACMSGRGYSVK